MQHNNILSFTDYIADKFDNKFWDAASKFKTTLSSNKLKLVGETSIDRVDVMHVYTKEQNNILSIDVAVKITYELLEGDHHYDNYDTQSKWMMCYCKASLDKDLDDFRIIRTEEYFPHSNSNDDLSDSLIPYISKNDLEDVAEDFLERYYPQTMKITKVGEKPIAVNPKVLASNMGLKILSRRIKEDGSVFGRIYFNDTNTELYDESSEREESVHIDANTIVVDPYIYYLRTLGTVNNTIVHECVHFDKHYKAFKLAQLYNKDTSCISCETTDEFNMPKIKSGGWFMEWQANQLTPRIQMPAKPFKSKAEEYINKHVKRLVVENPDRNVYRHEAMESVIRELASDFGVSIQSTKIRLIELGFEDAIGTFNYVDGHYVKPHSFKKGSIELNQTFTIGIKDAFIQSMVDSSLREKLEKNEYIFVENHFVYNSSLYINSNKDTVELTPYARAHMDECCLSFDLKAKNGQFDNILYTVCYLNKDNNYISIDVKFHGNLENSPRKDQIDFLLKQHEEEVDVYNKMTNNPKQCMELLMNWRNINNNELADESSLSIDTISRIINGKQDANRSTLLLICLAMHLPFQISMKLFEVFGIPLLAGNESHLAVMKILQLCYLNNIDENIELLKELGVEVNSRKKL